MIPYGLKQLVARGEGQHLEFKRKVPRPERMAKEVVAFANSGGGRVLIGVDDGGTVTGVKDATETEYALRIALEGHCDPLPAFTTERIPISRKRDVILVDVPASRERPHFVVHEQSRIAFVRVEDMSIEASREAVRIMRAGEQQEDVLFEFGEKELKLMRYLDTYGQITVPQFARLAGIARRRASHTLVLLVKARILQFHADARQDFFTLAAVHK